VPVATGDGVKSPGRQTAANRDEQKGFMTGVLMKRCNREKTLLHSLSVRWRKDTLVRWKSVLNDARQSRKPENMGVIVKYFKFG
jgi:hypothetical protein